MRQETDMWLVSVEGVQTLARPRKRQVRRVAAHVRDTASEDHWRGLYAVLACGILVLDAAGALYDANDAAQDILGISLAHIRGQELGRTLATATREDGSELPAAERPSQKALRTGQPQRDVVMGITRHDGGQRWLQVDAVPVRDDSGVVTRVVTSFIDVTARKQAERDLRESEARKGAILDGALDAIITVTHDGRIAEFNPAAERLFGYSRAEAQGQAVATLIVPPSHRERHERVRQQHIATGQASAVGQRVEGWAVRRDGVEFPVEVTTTRIPDANPPVFIGYIRDITARKKMEEEAQRQAEALRYQALHDSLTGLPNRTLFYDRLTQALRATQRSQQPLALLLVDLDRFKDVNDSLGHDHGDRLLQQVGARLQTALRASDTVARLGGDEFAVLLPGSGVEGATQSAHSILAVLTAPFALSDNPAVDGHRLTIGASIGIALAPDHGQEDAALLRYADMTMYAAKRARNGYMVYAPS